MNTNANASTLKDKLFAHGNGKAKPVVARSPLEPTHFMQRILSEELFLGMLCLERKRAERSSKKFLLLLLDAENAEKTGRKAEILKGVVKAANVARRETDPAGWYKHNTILGIIFIELEALDETATVRRLLEKMHEALVEQLSAEDLQHVRISVHMFGDDSNGEGSDISANPTLYPDLFRRQDSKKVSFLLKRVMDIVGSTVALILFAPLFVLIAAIVKLTSKGPVFFTQERLGQFGKTFTCLKFRSMYADNDPKIHQEFMKGVISGTHGGGTDGSAEGGSKPVYKMTNDPRITRIGQILRRTSLDELPQFINVLKGDMSLVGPRPPLAYEYEEYDLWHRRRVLEVNPGITGLWQVRGRSRVSFDDMVRLDLQYARNWSLWLDIQILAQTPRAVLFGDDAF